MKVHTRKRFRIRRCCSTITCARTLALCTVCACRKLYLLLTANGDTVNRYAVPLVRDNLKNRVGVVISTCNSSLLWLETANLTCDVHDIFVYMRCQRTTQKVNDDFTSHLDACVTYIPLEKTSSGQGRAHHAYLSHIIRNWKHLHPITAFLKDTNIHSASALARLHSGVDYKSLADTRLSESKRGRASWGLEAFKTAQWPQKLKRATHPAYACKSLTERFVSFRSVFAASDKQLRRNSITFYNDLLTFVLEEHDGEEDCVDLSPVCQERCPNCELLERLWAEILLCGDLFTPFHAAHSTQENYSSSVQPKVCYTNGAPLMLVSATIDSKKRICFDDEFEESMLSLYLAGMLRWDIILASSSEACSRGMSIVYDASHFKNRIRDDLGLQVLEKVPEGYKIIDLFTDSQNKLAEIVLELAKIEDRVAVHVHFETDVSAIEIEKQKYFSFMNDLFLPSEAKLARVRV